MIEASIRYSVCIHSSDASSNQLNVLPPPAHDDERGA
jgi:hypothetical protein